MKQTRITAILLALLVLAASIPAPVLATGNTQSQNCTFPVTITDAMGTEVTIESEPQSIVTLTPSAAQTLWEIGAKDEVVGISEFATYLEGTEQKTIVNTDSGGIDVEKVIALQPDLVLAPGIVPNETIKTLRSKGLTVVVLESPRSIKGVARKTTRIGRVTGHCTGAAETNAWMQTNVQAVRDAVAETEHPRAMYIFYSYTVGANTFINDMMTSAGTTNIMAEAGVTGYAQVNDEIVRERNPQWFIVNTGDPGVPGGAAFNETIAAKQNQTVLVELNYMNQPAPRSVVNVVHTIASTVHPEAMADVDIVPRSQFERTSTTTTPQTTTEQRTTTTTTPRETTGAAAPGFGIEVGFAASIVALLTALLLTRR